MEPPRIAHYREYLLTPGCFSKKYVLETWVELHKHPKELMFFFHWCEDSPNHTRGLSSPAWLSVFRGRFGQRGVLGGGAAYTIGQTATSSRVLPIPLRLRRSVQLFAIARTFLPGKQATLIG